MSRDHEVKETCESAERSDPATPLEEADLTDRERVGILLQGAVLLAELAAADRHLPEGWEAAGLDRRGRLTVPSFAPGGDSEMVQRRLRDLVARLFGSGERVAGRGEGRRSVRRLLDRWSQELTPVPPRRAVRQVLEAAPFLREGAVGGEPLPSGDPADDVELGSRLYRRGRFEAALTALAGVDDAEGELGARAEVLRLRCRLLLGELGAVLHRLGILADRSLPAPEVVDLAEVAARAGSNGNRPETARLWIERALAEAERAEPEGGPLRARALVVAAQSAWDRGEDAEVGRLVREAGETVEIDRHPRVAWRWHQVRGLLAVAEGDGQAAVAGFVRALTLDRRGLCRHEAGGLWNDLGMGRAQSGDLPGAERAFHHAARLLDACDGARHATLALTNLAEVRLRRGQTLGVEKILRRSAEENRLNGNLRALVQDLGLWARFELVLGRPAAALEHCREASELLERRGLTWHRDELRLLEARVLGRLRRPVEAAEVLAGVPVSAFGELEPEEIPALFALADLPDAALVAATGTELEPLWDRLLAGVAGEAAPEVPATLWEPLDRLEPPRAARVVLDAETLLPGAAPPSRRRRAVAAFRRIGAARYAETLERIDQGPWRAVTRYLGDRESDGPGSPEAIRRLLGEAGYPESRIEVHRDHEPSPEVVVGGPGGEGELAAPAEDGRLVLKTPVIDPALRALFALVLRDLVGSRGDGDGGGPARGRTSRRNRVLRRDIVGESPALLAALERIERLAPGDLPLLLLGESGTGKELAARHLHRSGPRREGPFVAVNCAAVSDNLLLSDLFGHVRGAFTGADRDRQGVFETAEGGTVFLDEIGDLPASAQGMLLRVLQEGEVRRVGESLPRRIDVRVVAATHRDLRAMVGEGEFREDLYYRLGAAAVELPPLRERGRDVLLLAEHVLDAAGSSARLASSARSRLLAHDWPGNVRELENAVRLAAALAAGDRIAAEHLELEDGSCGDEPARGDYHARVEAFRRRLVTEALEETGGNKAAAARLLGLSRQALSYLTKELRIVV